MNPTRQSGGEVSDSKFSALDRYVQGLAIGTLSLLAVYAAIVLGPTLLLAACATIPGLGPDLGVIEDPSLRTFLSSLTLVENQGCTLTARGSHLTARCRVFRGPADERIVAAYDIVTDRPLVVMLLRDDGRQEILWRPARQSRTGEPEVKL